MVRRNGAGSGYARSRWTVKGEMGRNWGTEELRPRTPANGNHGGQRRRNRPIEPHLASNRGIGSCPAQRNRWQKGWRDELEGGAAVERERRPEVGGADDGMAAVSCCRLREGEEEENGG
jgi:hypothetical protein